MHAREGRHDPRRRTSPGELTAGDLMTRPAVTTSRTDEDIRREITEDVIADGFCQPTPAPPTRTRRTSDDRQAVLHGKAKARIVLEP